MRTDFFYVFLHSFNGVNGVLVWICRFPLPHGVWEGLRFVLVALPGLFSYLFFFFFFFFFFFDDMSLAWPAVVQLLVFIYSGIQ